MRGNVSLLKTLNPLSLSMIYLLPVPVLQGCLIFDIVLLLILLLYVHLYTLTFYPLSGKDSSISFVK